MSCRAPLRACHRNGRLCIESGTWIANNPFLRTYQDLASVTHGMPDEYVLLKASGILRQLLLDSHPLLHQVRHGRLERIVFEAAAEDTYIRKVLEDGPRFWAFMDGISLQMALGARVVSEALPLDRFLAKESSGR